METNLYRKYRPNNFDQVVGQQVVVRTLINSIKNQTIAHAYLFSGVRGTGKTSIAKIFAKAINCQNTENPMCGECEMCKEFASQTEMPDIFEIDAASNNGVEEIRKIIDNVKYMPIRMKYKVYIIDEVHMLSKGAFNALLKTLEEPPGHVIFILATTEPNKIPVTILSRVQRFEFTRISDEPMLEHLCKVLDLESVSYDIEALKLIVTHAQGGLRDALSLLTKVISFAPEVTIATVTESLNLASKSVSSDLLDAIIENRSEDVSSNFKQLINGGADEAYLVQDLIEVAKERLIENLANGSEDVPVYTKIITKLMETLANIKIISNSSLYIEVALIELSVKPKQVAPQVVIAPQEEKPKVSEQDKLDKLQRQAEMLKAAAANTEPVTPKPEPISEQQPVLELPVTPNPEPVIEQQPVSAPKQVNAKPTEDVELQMDILFSNKTGKDVSELTAQVEEQPVVEESINEEQPVIEETVVEEPIIETEEPAMVEEVIAEAVTSEEPIVTEEPAVGEETVAEEPVVVEESIASSIASPAALESVTVNKVRSELDDITIIDTLKAATKDDKKRSLIAARNAANELNNSKQYGIAKFFEVSNVQGASSTGIVVSIDQNFYSTYESRLDQIQQIYSNHIGSSVKVHLITTQYWKQERMNFVRAVKENMQVDIYKEATDFFGKDLVNKVNS